jgi:hypothetical protein
MPFEKKLKNFYTTMNLSMAVETPEYRDWGRDAKEASHNELSTANNRRRETK